MNDLIFKNIKVGYIPDCEVEINNKKYLIHDVIDGEDIKVSFDSKYPKLNEVIKKSPHRIPYKESECGGANFMHIDYQYEIELKHNYLNDLFKSFHVKDVEIIPMDNPYNYRNKTQMTYKLSKTKKIVCGLYEEYSHNIVTAENNILQSKVANKLSIILNKVLTKNKISVYDEKSRTGILRHVFIRYGFNSKEIMLVLVTNGEMFPGRNNVIQDLKKENLNITTIVQNYNSRDTSIVLGDKERVLYGPGYIYENISGYKFKISPKSFFQVNTKGMEILYNKAIELAKFSKNEIVIDAYCGVGTISCFIAKYVKHVYGVELNKGAILDAKINQKINNIFNITFIADDATNFITNLAKNKEHIDAVVMDPPREGSTKAFINAIDHLNIKKVIYISCNPLTLKRDSYQFFENEYKLEKLISVDNFPRTIHCEMIAVFKKDNEFDELEKLRKENTKKYKENKIRYIPKADIEMMINDKYEANGFKNKTKK